MAVSVLEERLQQQFRRVGRKNHREGVAQGIEQGIERGLAAERQLLRRQAARRFGAATAARLDGLLADIRDTEGLEPVGDWIIDCADGDELIARFGNGASPGT